MTYEEFEKLALEPTYTEEPSVYRIDVYRIIEPSANRIAFILESDIGIEDLWKELDKSPIEPGNDIDYYPEYKVYKSDCYMFSSFEEAKQFITSDEISHFDENQIYCIRVFELPFGKDVISDCCKREWIFDENCNLIEQSVCSSLNEDLDKPEGKFWGRPKDSIRFRPGDIVEVHDREKGVVKLAIVKSLQNDIESCWAVYQGVISTCKIEGVGVENADSNYWLNASDDCYEIIDGPAPEDRHYICTTDVFTPRFPISEHLTKNLLKWYKASQNISHL